MGVILGGQVMPGLEVAGAPVAGTDEVQTITFGGTPTGGTFQLRYDGHVTGQITWVGVNATLVANIDAALEALANIGTGNVTTAAATMTAGIGTATVTFVSGLGKRAVNTIVAHSNSMTGTAPTLAVAETTPGVDATFLGAPKGTQITDTQNGIVYVNTGSGQAPTWVKVGSQV